MNRNTKELIDALKAVTMHADGIANGLMLDQIPPHKQREYANLLQELAGLLREHAESQEKEDKA